MTRKNKEFVRIGGASGYWGESAMATPQFLRPHYALDGGLDYIVYDYLAEITMSIMARARAKDPEAGYASDFISAVLKPHLAEIARQKVKIISNAGGVNPEACAKAARALIAEAGLDLKVAVVTGDNLMARKDEFARTAPREMFTGAGFPGTDKIASINAYLGAFPIAQALGMGANIVIIGRCVDSAVTLGALIHEFGWAHDDWNRLAGGSLAGHILECGPQATGGNFTDWEAAGDIANIGYPIAEIAADGSFAVTKPESTGGLVSIGTVSEQMLYEIGDPQRYILPDVVCDFSGVRISQEGENRVRVAGAKGRPSPADYKCSLTWQDGWRAGLTFTFYGADADRKAQKSAEAVLKRARAVLRQHNAIDFSETSIEIIGAESQFGAFAENAGPREVVAKIAVKHPDMMGAGLLLKEAAGIGLAAPPGLSGFAGGRPKPSPVVRLFSFLTPKSDIELAVATETKTVAFRDAPGAPVDESGIARPALPPAPDDATVAVSLIRLAWARSGDKGDKANIGVIARKAEYLPYLWAALTEKTVAERFAHFIEGEDKAAKVSRFLLPGSNAINFVVDAVLGGGGVASIRNDPQGKGYGQILLATPVAVSEAIAAPITAEVR